MTKHTNPTELAVLRNAFKQQDELLNGIKRRIGVALNERDANSQWLINHMIGMQRFITDWERRTFSKRKGESK